jgi:hypothetical protein
MISHRDLKIEWDDRSFFRPGWREYKNSCSYVGKIVDVDFRRKRGRFGLNSELISAPLELPQQP